MRVVHLDDDDDRRHQSEGHCDDRHRISHAGRDAQKNKKTETHSTVLPTSLFLTSAFRTMRRATQLLTNSALSIPKPITDTRLCPDHPVVWCHANREGRSAYHVVDRHITQGVASDVMKEPKCCLVVEYSVLEENHQERNQNRCRTSACRSNITCL